MILNMTRSLAGLGQWTKGFSTMAVMLDNVSRGEAC